MGRVSYATELVNPDTPSIRGFVLAEDRLGCEAAITSFKTEMVNRRAVESVHFGGCRRSVLEPGSDYWASSAHLEAGGTLTVGSTIRAFCEASARRLTAKPAPCTPTTIRFIDPVP
jgi:hypothetical protein